MANELTAITVIRAIPGRTLIRRVLSWPSSTGSSMSHQHEIARCRLWRFPGCIFRSWMAGRGLVKQRDVLAHPDRTRGQCLRHAGRSRGSFLASPRATGMWRTRRSSFAHSLRRSASLAKFPRYRAVSSSRLCHCAGSHAGLRSAGRPLGDAILLGSGTLDNVRGRHRSNRASGRVRCVLWGSSDASRRAQTKTIKRNCFSSAFCYSKEEGCAERCDDPRRDILRPVSPARR